MASTSPAAGESLPDYVTVSECVKQGKGDEGDSSKVMHTPPIGPKAEEYKMNHERRGRAIILNHEKYSESLKLKERTGTITDKITLKQRFEKLNFDVSVHDDLTVADIKKLLSHISQLDHRNEDCIVVAVLTHGRGKGKLYAYDELYKVDLLWSSFTADVCPSLGGRPKIFIVQACRGDEASEGMSFKSSIQLDSSKMNMEATSHRYSIPAEADLLIAFRRVALRDTEDGTWFIQEFCKELEDNGDKMDLLSLFTNVNRRVAVNKEYKKLKQMPVVQSTLTRKIFLGSAVRRSNITLTSDVSCLLGKTNEKLDHITNMLQYRKQSVPIPRLRPDRKQSSSLNWDSLQSCKQTVASPMPQAESVYKISEGLKMFLEDEADRLKPTVKEDGEFLLNFLSCWETLNEELRYYGYKELVLFLNENAKNWKVYKFLDVPDSGSFSQSHHRRWSQSDVTDAGSSPNKTSTIPRRIVSKKYK
ncbi:caspase-1-like isoform X2 [Zootermopsis nevadensis]|uniref:caspase-1-like isoform X2 n=1 Tax=Zootermopsis nevadensis TaxID=136037 RepID=UPI000B8EC41C|nr:caspase-1-like isoform X2 [Zootermopsis nevadensis]